MLLTKNMTEQDIIDLASCRPEVPWHWGVRIESNPKIQQTLLELELIPHWGEPIRQGDLYLAIRNTGPRLLTCKFLGEGCVHSVELAYSFDFSECVKITEK
jgi:hypothetical protein